MFQLSQTERPGREEKLSAIRSSNYFRCKSLGLGPKFRSRLDSRKGVGECQAWNVETNGIWVQVFKVSELQSCFKWFGAFDSIAYPEP